jgi:hypothetical protein
MNYSNDTTVFFVLVNVSHGFIYLFGGGGGTHVLSQGLRDPWEAQTSHFDVRTRYKELVPSHPKL